MQQIQLAMFFVAVTAALVVTGCILGRKPRKKLRTEIMRPPDELSLAVSLSKKKRAVIGRAAGAPHRPLKKLNQVCDPRGDSYARWARQPPIPKIVCLLLKPKINSMLWFSGKSKQSVVLNSQAFIDATEYIPAHQVSGDICGLRTAVCRAQRTL
jgi:hypothetical protein